jgi:acyl-coenzyme A synthetase/AMP-(fatty) acid ligase
MAFVVLGGGGATGSEAATTGPEIAAWAREQMANYKAPRTVEIVEELPINATGKVMKDELRARAAQASSESPA